MSRRPYDHPIAALPPPLPDDGPVPDLDWLDAALSASATWKHGPIREAAARRIGADFGFGGVVHRIDAATAHGEPVSLVAKREDAAAIERAVAVREQNPGALDGLVPELYSSQVVNDEGILLMELVDPATQGDVLAGCTDERAESLVRGIARLHARSFEADRSSTTWTVSIDEPSAWLTKLEAASLNHPDVLDGGMVKRLIDLPGAVQEAVGALGEDEWCWIHADLHLDNVVFEDGRSAIILDWASACIGPPSIDIGHILTEGLDRGTPAERIDRWGPVYAEETARFGVTVDLDRLRTSIGWSVLPLLQGVIGWASRDDVFADRLVRVRENLLRNTCEWFDTGIIPIEI